MKGRSTKRQARGARRASPHTGGPRHGGAAAVSDRASGPAATTMMGCIALNGDIQRADEVGFTRRSSRTAASRERMRWDSCGGAAEHNHRHLRLRNRAAKGRQSNRARCRAGGHSKGSNMCGDGREAGQDGPAGVGVQQQHVEAAGTRGNE